MHIEASISTRHLISHAIAFSNPTLYIGWRGEEREPPLPSLLSDFQSSKLLSYLLAASNRSCTNSTLLLLRSKLFWNLLVCFNPFFYMFLYALAPNRGLLGVGNPLDDVPSNLGCCTLKLNLSFYDWTSLDWTERPSI